MRFPVSLKQSLALHFIAVAVLPILLLGVISLRYFEQKHLETTFNLLDAHAMDVSHEATEFLQYINASLSSAEEILGSGILHNDDEINRYLQIVINESNSFESICLLDKDHRITHLRLSGGNGAHHDDYLGMDLSAHKIFSRQPILSDQTWSDTFLSEISAEPSITLGIPLENGTLLGTVSLKNLSAELVDRLGHDSRNFRFSLIDHHGVLIADSQPGLTSQRLNMRVHPEVRNALDQQVEVAGKFHEDNSLLESVRLVPKTGWVAYASLPMQDEIKWITLLRYLMIPLLTLAAFLGVVLSVWLSRRILTPILLLRDAAGAVAMGNYGQLPQAARYQELEDLSGSFREMVAAVEEREQAIRENRARYRDLVNSIDGIVWELDLAEFRFSFVSDQAEQILGYPVQSWLDEKDFWANHVHDEDRDWVVSFCLSETEALRDHDFEYRMITADGRAIWLKDIVTVNIEDGRPVSLRGVMIDISKRKQAELLLNETTERLQLLINRMPFGCVMWDAENRAELWNPAAEKIFGFSSDEAVGLQPFEFLVPEQVKQDVSQLSGRLEQVDPLAYSINENLTRDGRTITCEWHNTPTHNSDGTIAGVISMVQDITQRISAENALKESETRFRTVFQTNPDAVLIFRQSDSRIVDVNDSCLDMIGYTREELIEKTALELGLWANPAERGSYLALIRSQGAFENFEMSLRVKNGRVRIGLASARVLLLNNVNCVLVAIRDITAIKEAEMRLVRSELRFRSLISVMGEGVIILGYNGEVVQCNQAAERILMTKVDDLVGKFHDEVIREAFREDGSLLKPAEHPSAVTLGSGEPVSNQIMGIPRVDGQTTWLQVNTHALGLDQTGKPVAVVISFADVTRLKRTENELRESEQYLQTLSTQFQGVLEAIPDRIMILDKQMRVIWLNWFEDDLSPQGQKLLADARCYELAGVCCGPSSETGSSLCDACPVTKAFSTGRVETCQKETSDGRTVSLRAFPVFNELGEIINVIEIAQDVTESLRQQAQAMRNGQLAALGELAAGVAHEINNPINGVINYAQLILNKAALDSREQELSQRIIRESERVATIVRELLYFAREENQEFIIARVSDALNEALALTHNLLYKEGVQLQILLPDDLPMIRSRSHQIQQLFLNLISNARYALSEKYPEADPDKILQVKGEEIPKDGRSFVRITFRDHGVGIDAELLPRVMNPFTTTKSSRDGTGLGLSISHEIVQKHGGTLSIDSVHGEFTEVVIELPAEEPS